MGLILCHAVGRSAYGGKWVSIRKISRPPRDWQDNKQTIYSGGYQDKGVGEIRAGKGKRTCFEQPERQRIGIYD